MTKTFGITQVVPETSRRELPPSQIFQLEIFETPDQLINKLINSLTGESKPKDFGSLARLLHQSAEHSMALSQLSLLR